MSPAVQSLGCAGLPSKASMAIVSARPQALRSGRISCSSWRGRRRGVQICVRAALCLLGAGTALYLLEACRWSFLAIYIGRAQTDRSRCAVQRHQSFQDDGPGLDDAQEAQDVPRADKYQVLSPRTHVLTRPDMYIGPVEPRAETEWILERKNGQLVMEEEELMLSPGLVQIYNEILVNAIDRQYDATSGRDMSEIRITVDQKQGEITVWNNGGAIPVERHQKSGLYVPTMVFGEFLSGENFDDSKIRFVGGRNGVGAKATNAFSELFEVHVDDPGTRKHFVQRWEDNMEHRREPEISDLQDHVKQGSVLVRFKPDLPRFGLRRIDGDHLKILMSRAYDAAACTRDGIKVSFNDKELVANNFREYCSQVLGSDMAMTKVVDANGEVRAEVAVAFAGDNGFSALGFVNGIRCSMGTHITKVVSVLADGIWSLAETQGIKKKPQAALVKQYIRVVVKVLVNSPDFDSQTKTKLTTTQSKLGFDLRLPSQFVEQVASLGVLDAAVRAMHAAQTRGIRRVMNSATRPSLAKLEDATRAGMSKSNCTLIVTEGDSAKGLAMAGLAKVGREFYGIFPLKGKLLNVRSATQKQLETNEEIKNLMQIIGLEWGKKYTAGEIAALRYQRLMIFSDQDLDGHHIAGLLMNFILAQWPSVLKVKPDFVQRFATPIVKVSGKGNGRTQKSFFTQGEFQAWQLGEGEDWNKKYKAKYYKGLGTSTREEAIEYFSDLDQHVISLRLENQEGVEAMEKAFDPSRAEDRKEWLRKYNPEEELDYSKSSAGYKEFVDKQLAHYSVYDNRRSIPLLLDGLKPSQRKVLHWAMKHLRGEEKVSQITGKVSSATSYHHGEMSLVKVIVSLAQDFVGTNNINLLKPNGMFGSRLNGRDVHASARYIYTELSPLVPFIFRKEDSAILEEQQEEGHEIEPKSLLPVLPLVLINGFQGIGTGWATSSPNYDPLDVVHFLEQLIKGKQKPSTPTPWYRGFEGNTRVVGGRIFSEGAWTVYGSQGDEAGYDTVEITELPVGVWTDDFVKSVEDKAKRTGFMMTIHKCSDHDDTRVHLVLGCVVSELLQLAKGKKDRVRSAVGDHLGLRKPLQSNMWLFHNTGSGELSLRKFESASNVIESFYQARLPYYGRRKEAMLQQVRTEAMMFKNQVRCIDLCQNGSLSLKQLDARTLRAAGFDPIAHGSVSAGKPENQADGLSSDMGFEYILRMQLRSFSEEKANELRTKMRKAEESFKMLQSTSIEEMWLQDLQEFRNAYKNEKLPPRPLLPASEEQAAQEHFNLERKRRAKGLQDQDDGMDNPAWLKKQTLRSLKEMCSSRGLKIAGMKRQELENVLLCYFSMAYSPADWSKFTVAELRAHANARGLGKGASTRKQLVDELSQAGIPKLELALSRKQIVEELRTFGLETAGYSAEELRDRILEVRIRKAREDMTLRQLSLVELQNMSKKQGLQIGGAKNAVVDRLSADLVRTKSEDLGLKRKRKPRKTAWVDAIAQARKELNVTGFTGVKKGTEFYDRAKAILAEMQATQAPKGENEITSAVSRVESSEGLGLRRTGMQREIRWVDALSQARQELKWTGSVAAKKGTEYYDRAMTIYTEAKAALALETTRESS